MGYAATVAAFASLEAINRSVTASLVHARPSGVSGALAADLGLPSNAMPDSGFYEIGREHASRAMTGTVYAAVGEDKCRRRGSFRIEPSGIVSRFPGIDRSVIQKINERVRAVARCQTATGQIRGTPPVTASNYKTRAASLAAFLRAEGDAVARDCWADFQAVCTAWQSATGAMFTELPKAEAVAMAGWLENID